jgi:hypothetical protein
MMVFGNRSAIAADDLREAREAVLGWRARVESISATLESEVRDTPDEPRIREHFRASGFTRELAIPRDSRTYSESLSLLSGMARLERKLSPDTTKALTDARAAAYLSEKWVITPERAESLAKHLGDLSMGGSIRHPKEAPIWLTVDVALSLRGYQQFPWIDARAFEAAEFRAGKAGDVIVTMRGGGDTSHAWSFRREWGYAPQSYVAKTKDGLSILEIENSDFRLTSGIFLPYRIKRSTKNFIKELGELGATIQTVEITVTNWMVGAADNTRESYRMLWPKGTMVADTRSGIDLIVERDGVLEDATIAEAGGHRASGTDSALEEARKRIRRVSEGRDNEGANSASGGKSKAGKE